MVTLVLCTVGRSEELRRCLESLRRQRCAPSHELIVVDQNEDAAIVARALDDVGFADGVLHLRCPRVSLSYARNVGLDHRRGRLLAFPDDDCEYPPHVLERVSSEYADADNRTAGVCFRYPGDRIPPRARTVDADRSLGKIISFSFVLFCDRLPSGLPRFDERLGVGAYFGACEETDFILRASSGLRFRVLHDVRIDHPEKRFACALRERGYGRGFGALARILLSRRPLAHAPTAAKLMGGPVVRILLSLMLARPREVPFHWAGVAGRVDGFLRFR